MTTVTPQMLNNSAADAIPPAAAVPTELPGRGDLRISLTSRCPLRCAHCHNEGQPVPWMKGVPEQPLSIQSITDLLDLAANYRVNSVKFTGGEPGLSPLFPGVVAALPNWRLRYPHVCRWGISTNGTPFLDHVRYQLLAQSSFDNICVGLDSIESGELSKPSSSTGVTGRKLLEDFVVPLSKEWKNRRVKVNVVFTGNRIRVINVIKAARRLGVEVSVIEVNALNRQPHKVRNDFFALINEIACEYSLVPKLFAPLNEIYLFDESGASPVKFYQDHCQDEDCGNCRNMHLRVSPSIDGWQAVPCLLQDQYRTIPLTVEKALSTARFEDAIRLNGRGPSWFVGTIYGTEPSKSAHQIHE